MKKCIKFPSIEQFRNVVRDIQLRHTYVGKDDNGNPVYDVTKTLPTLTFKGTVKLHGTNAGVSYNIVDDIWYQSRENIITPLKDNAGFATFGESRKDLLVDMIENLASKNDVNLQENSITLYGEWIGKGIQKNVAISELDKRFVIFGAKVSPFNEELVSYWIDYSNLRDEDNGIYNILDSKMYEITIDFNNPLLSQNEIVDLTLEVEQECPFAKMFGVTGIGEGIVFSYETEDGQIIRFKSKGELHQKSKVTTLKKVDDVKINLVQEISHKLTPTWRLDQAIENVYNTLNGGIVDRSKVGEYIKWVLDDIVKEELDLIGSNNLSIKDVSKTVSDIARKHLFELV